jgi:type I restriction enzyme S subunit
MSIWRDCKLGDVLTLQRGFDLPASNRRAGAVPVVSSSGITGFHDEAKARGPGVVIGRYGTLGEVHFVNEDYWPLNTSLYVKDFKGNDPRYCSYLLKTVGVANTSAAAAVPGVNRNVLHELPVRCPELRTQLRIASILGAYDNLIEVNRQRVALLEEITRRLFEEWFVRFKAPGCECSGSNQGPHGPVPAGWRVSKVRQLVERQRNGHVYRKVDCQSSGHVIVIDQSSEEMLGYHFNKPDHMATSIDPIAIFGDHTCKMQLLISPFSIGPNTVAFKAKPTVDIYYLFTLIRGLTQTNEYKRHWNDLMDKEVIVAPIDLTTSYAGKVRPLFQVQELLQGQNHNLRKQRDLLLPLLISGQLSVLAAEHELEAVA